MQVKQAMESGLPAWSMRLSPFRTGVDISALVGERSLFLFGPRQTGKSSFIREELTATPARWLRAKIMAVSRPALYAWLDGESEPARENADRLSALAAIARDFDATPTGPLFHGFVDRPVPGYSRSLLDILQDSPIDPVQLRPIVDRINRMTRDRERRIEDIRDASVLPPPSSTTQDRNLENNLSAIGPEG
ncbi:MAG: hypothetical protein ACLQMF_18790 [Rectinemataceae bacterium]